MDFTNYPYFQFRGRKSNEYNLRLLNEIDFVIAEASLDFQEIDGRQSDVIYDRGKYKDIEKRFPARLFKQSDKSIAQQLRDIAAWLYSAPKYSPLTFSEYPEYYYKALAFNGLTARDEQREWLDIDISFKCQPFVFRLDGEDYREIKSGATITNPEPFSSLPSITFKKTTSTSDSNIYIEGKQFRIAKEAGTGVITIDSENGIAYKEGGVNISRYCLLNAEGYQPITIAPGRNEISYTNMTDFKIRPRWRTLAV